MQATILSYPLSISKWEEKGGGVSNELLRKAQNGLSEFLANCYDAEYVIKDIKINHFTANRHNNGGYDEIWVQYTILYEV